MERLQELKDKKGFEMLFFDYSQYSLNLIALADACNGLLQDWTYMVTYGSGRGSWCLPLPTELLYVDGLQGRGIFLFSCIPIGGTTRLQRIVPNPWLLKSWLNSMGIKRDMNVGKELVGGAIGLGRRLWKGVCVGVIELFFSGLRLISF